MVRDDKYYVGTTRRWIMERLITMTEPLPEFHLPGPQYRKTSMKNREISQRIGSQSPPRNSETLGSSMKSADASSSPRSHLRVVKVDQHYVPLSGPPSSVEPPVCPSPVYFASIKLDSRTLVPVTVPLMAPIGQISTEAEGNNIDARLPESFTVFDLIAGDAEALVSRISHGEAQYR